MKSFVVYFLVLLVVLFIPVGAIAKTEELGDKIALPAAEQVQEELETEGFAQSAQLLSSAKFIDNSNYIESTMNTLGTMYRNKQTFIAFLYRPSCGNSLARKTVLDKWMTAHNVKVYGLNNDVYGAENWWRTFNSSQGSLPWICFVKNGKAITFTASDSMRAIQQKLEDHLGVIDTVTTDFYDINYKVYSSFGNGQATLTEYLKPTARIQSSESAIINQSNSIVSNAKATTNYDKVKAIHAWVAGNVYYNWPMYEDMSAGVTDALNVLYTKRSVCSGYANLTAALIRAQGIPCKVVNGYALGVGSDTNFHKIWEAYEAYIKDKDLEKFRKSVSINHAWNAAYVNGKWIFLDTTWDSKLEYYGPGNYVIQGTYTTQYLDPSLAFFSNTHLFWETGNAVEDVRDGWQEENGVRRYYINGQPAWGWKTIDSKLRYFDNGIPLHGIYYVEGYYRYFLEGGIVPEPGFYGWDGYYRCVGDGGILKPAGFHNFKGAWRVVLDWGILAPAGIHAISGAYRCVANEGLLLPAGVHYVKGAWRGVLDGGVLAPEGIYILANSYRYVGNEGLLKPAGVYIIKGAWRGLVDGSILPPPGVYTIAGHKRCILEGGILAPAGWYTINGVSTYVGDGGIVAK